MDCIQQWLDSNPDLFTVLALVVLVYLIFYGD